MKLPWGLLPRRPRERLPVLLLLCIRSVLSTSTPDPSTASRGPDCCRWRVVTRWSGLGAPLCWLCRRSLPPGPGSMLYLSPATFEGRFGAVTRIRKRLYIMPEVRWCRLTMVYLPRALGAGHA